MDKVTKFKMVRLSMGLTYAPLLLTWQEYRKDWVGAAKAYHYDDQDSGEKFSRSYNGGYGFY